MVSEGAKNQATIRTMCDFGLGFFKWTVRYFVPYRLYGTYHGLAEKKSSVAVFGALSDLVVVAQREVPSLVALPPEKHLGHINLAIGELTNQREKHTKSTSLWSRNPPSSNQVFLMLVIPALKANVAKTKPNFDADPCVY